MCKPDTDGSIGQHTYLLINPEQRSTDEVQQHYQSLLDEMRQEVCASEPLRKMIATFLKVTDSYRSGLFHCYDMAELPRTNNDLEHLFGSTCYHERRATGRKHASPGLLIEDYVRIVASVASQHYRFRQPDFQPHNLAHWRSLRTQVNGRHEARQRAIPF